MDNVKPQLYLNMIIAENEPLDIVKRGIDSVKDYVDGMYITVTYNDIQPQETSELSSLLKEVYQAEVSFFKWEDDFSTARQYALDQVPRGKNIYVYWQDADDILHGAEKLREAMETAIRWQWSGIFMVYWYRVEVDENNEVKQILIEQQRERIIQNDGIYTWRGMLHETLIGQRVENVQHRLWKDSVVIHLTTEERVDLAMERNIRILEKQMEGEKHRDPRTLVYLAKAYYDKGVEEYKRVQSLSSDSSPLEDKAIKARDLYHDKALILFDEYLRGKGEIGDKDAIEQSGWPEERATGWQYVSEIFVLRQLYEQALGAINEAIEEAPQFPQYYIAKAMIYTHTKEWKKAKHWLVIATNIENPQTTLMSAPRDMKVRVLECDAHIAMHYDNDLKRVADDYRRLLEIAPGNETYEQNLQVAESLEASNRGMQSVVYLGKYLERIGEPEKIIPLLQAVPTEFQREPFYAQMRHQHIPPRLWEENEIAILCGPGFEAWTPKSIDKGVGGSEEAVIYLAQELSQQGWKVTVYANPEGEEGDYDGVTYLNYYKLNPDDLFNHLILWRGIGFVDINPKTRGQIILWMHDMPNVPDFTPERLKKVDKIAVLSEFHKQQIKMYDNVNDKYLAIPDDKFFLTRNGIPDLDITTWKGNPHRMCYVSSPDRGLIYLLKHWKTIKDAVPDAELHIYYGFEIYDYIHRNNPAKIAFKKKIMELMKQEGITYHGRVGHKELAREMNKCGIWTYPTDFTEISCISAMKAQAVGAVPVVTDFAALKETVKNGIRIDVDIQEKSGQKVYIDTVIDVLKHPKTQQENRNMQWSQDYFSWKKVAEQWSALLRGIPVENMVMTPEQWQKYLLGKDKKEQLQKEG